MATAALARPAEKRVSTREWISVAGVLLGAFMAILDIQITNASLKDIQGALSATLEEGSWISTAYLVAEIVVIPMTGWLAMVFSKKLYLLWSAGLFTFFSLCCAWAWNLDSMIFFRACQGFFGGALIPLAFTIILTTLPPSKHPIGLAMFGFTATFAPSFGPTVGGWLTEAFGWEYIFYLNLIPGLLLIAAVWFTIDQEPTQLQMLKTGDWWGIVAMAIGLGSLQVVLEEGARKDWFGSELILRLAVVAGIFLVLFFWIEFTTQNPFINLRLLARRNFGLGSIVNLSLGLGLYGSVYILPLYLAQVQGYNALQIGLVIMVSGVPQLLLIPLVPLLMRTFDPRWILGTGVFLFGFSCFMNGFMSHETGGDQLLLSQLVRALGQPLIITPLAAIVTGDIPQTKDAGSASGLFNMMRNLGGSMGIALLATLLLQRERFYSARIGESVSLYSVQTQERLAQLTQNLVNQGTDPVTAQMQAMELIDNLVRREAYVLAYNDCFLFIAAGFAVSFMAVLWLKKPELSGGGGGH